MLMPPEPKTEPPLAARPPSEVSQDELKREDFDATPLLPEQVREVVRLFQCPRCSCPLQTPVTLPCGRTICRKCLPETHARANISYPATASRLQGFECPFPDCQKEHALGDCALDVVLDKTVTNVRAELERGRAEARGPQYAVDVAARDSWAVAGISSLHDADVSSHVLSGGRIAATYALAEMGQLGYLAEVNYTVVSDAEQQADHDGAVLERIKGTTRTEMDCQVCYAMYYDPITTTCGHTFCRHCLLRVLDHGPHCPICRRPLAIPSIERRSSPSNELISRITSAFWSDDLKVRKQMVMAENLHNDTEFDLPVFVCTLAFPLMPTFLHIFEPRYRLMIRRALEGDRAFGMVAPQRPRSSGQPSFREYGTLLHITNVEFFPDGRSLIETMGMHRFRIVRHGMLDGYIVAKTEKVNDISIAEEEELEAAQTRTEPVDRGDPAEGPGSIPEAPDSGDGAPTSASRTPITRNDIRTMATKDLMDFAQDFVRRMTEESVGWLAARVLAIYGECPSDPVVFPWWFGSVLPVKDEEKYRVLGAVSVRERLQICCEWILEWEASRW